MSEVIDGVKTDLPPDVIKDIMPDAPATPEKGQEAEPPKPAAEPTLPAEPAKAEAEPKAPEAEKPTEQPRDESGKFRPEKPRPIANLLAKKHELETALAERDVKLAQLQAQVETLSSKPDSFDSKGKVKALAEKFGVDEAFLDELVSTLRLESANPTLPSEVKELLEEHKLSKAVVAEREAFDKRFSSLSKAIPELAAHKDRIEELAYSDQVAPDGEPYSKKELSEIYFQFIKPEVEPGKKSGEQPSGGGGAVKSKVIDFQEMTDRDDPEEFRRLFEEQPEMIKKFGAWQAEKAERARGGRPISIG